MEWPFAPLCDHKKKEYKRPLNLLFILLFLFLFLFSFVEKSITSRVFFFVVVALLVFVFSLKEILVGAGRC